MKSQLPFSILLQPNDSTCGPTCLHSIYRSYGDDIPFEQVIEEVTMLESGGTLAVLLASHALQRLLSHHLFLQAATVWPELVDPGRPRFKGRVTGADGL